MLAVVHHGCVHLAAGKTGDSPRRPAAQRRYRGFMVAAARLPRSVQTAAALAAGLALADSSVVVLALPQILAELHASVSGAAAVIGAYTLALGLALPVVVRFSSGHDAARLAVLGMAGFALAGVACGGARPSSC